MKSLYIYLIFIGQLAVAQEWPLIRTNTLFGVLGDGIQLGARVSYESTGSGDRFQNTYSIGQYIGMSYQSGRWLGTDSSRPSGAVLSEGSLISGASVEVGFGTSPFLGGYVIGISGFVWGYEVILEQAQPAIIPVGRRADVAPGRTNFLFGFKLFEDGNPDIAYYGWVELLRDQGDAVSQFRFGRHAIDYLPNRAIRAGREPERPALVSVVTPESTALSWDPFYTASGFRLERTESLTPPVTWEPVEMLAGATNVVIPNSASASALYRLVRP